MLFRGFITTISGAILCLAGSPSGALADLGSVNAACQNRVSAGLIQSAAIGFITNGAANEAFCGTVASEHQAYELGSISKTFAGIALAKLSVAGRIDLEAPISKYVPELEGSYMGTVTAHQLATHTALLVRSYSDPQHPASQGYDEYNEPQLIAFLKAYTPDPKQFPPGTRSYSNVGFGTLGMVLGRVGGQGYIQLIEKEILAPLGLSETGFLNTNIKPQSLLPGFDVLLRPVSYWSISESASGAGGVYSDLHDMMIYLRANLNPDQSDLGRAMTLSHQLGLGWDSLPGVLPTWKNGLMGGYATMLQFDPTQGTAVIVLGNEANGPSIEALSEIALGSPDNSHQLPVAPDLQAKVSGRYFSSDNAIEIDVAPFRQIYLSITIRQSGTVLSARLLSLAGEETKFAVDKATNSSDEIEFDVDPLTQQARVVYFNFKDLSSDGKPEYEQTSFWK